MSGTGAIRARLRACVVGGLVLAAQTASAQLPPVAIPFEASGVPLVDLVDVATYSLDLSTLPDRPRFTATVIAPPSHPDLELEVRITACDLEGVFGGPVCASSNPPAMGVGSAATAYDVYRCAPFGSTTATCDVEVRVLDFGATGAPASVDVTVTAESVVPAGTAAAEIDFVPTAQTVDVPAHSDTTIYEEDGTKSNGLGNEMHVGQRAFLDGLAFPPQIIRYELRALVAFDVGAALPPDAVIDDVEVELYVAGLALGGSVPEIRLEAVAPDADPLTEPGFLEGNGAAPEGSVFPPNTTIPSTTWTHRRFPGPRWTPGGTATGGTLASSVYPLIVPGFLTFSSPTLTSTVADMVANDTDRDGFRLRSPSLNGPSPVPRFLSFRTGEGGAVYGFGAPVMHVDFTAPLAAFVQGSLAVGTFSFIGEGQNFRWIYDTDDDGVLTTDLGGVCTADPFDPGIVSVPYDYAYTGDPSVQAIDCCTWSVATNTGVDGVGQALFYLGLDPTDPANHPADFDGDGIVDPCDSCPYTPNGPLLGTCMAGPNVGSSCVSDVDCGASDACEMFQTDSDALVPGDACPEPGFATGLGLGLLAVAAAARRSARERA